MPRIKGDQNSIYLPKKDRPMRLAVFGSGSGTNLEAILECGEDSFQVTAVFSDRQCRFLQIAEAAEIPTLFLSYSDFKKEHSGSAINVGEAYDQAILKLLLPFDIDLILLAGYMRIVHSPLLDHFQNRIINVHPADLTLQDENGKRRFVGAHAVEDALKAGVRKTRSTVHVVDSGVDSGPILLLGPEVVYTYGEPATEEKIRQHQEKQKKESDWPACIEAIRQIAEGRATIEHAH